MKYYEMVKEFMNNNKIDIKYVSYFIELFEIYRDINFLGEDNKNLDEIYSKGTVEDIINVRSSFIKSELSKLTLYISELLTLKDSNDPDSYILIDKLIKDKELFINKLTMELDNPINSNINELKGSLKYKHENNMKSILLCNTRLKEIDNHIEEVIDSPNLATYYILLKDQLGTLKLDKNSKDEPIIISNEMVKPINVDDGIFDYNVDQFDEVKIIRIEDSKKVIRYKSGEKHSYSIIENRDVLIRELDYWTKHMNNGFDRYDRDFYEEVLDTFNFITFYYKFKCYVMYSEINNRNYNLEGSKLEIEKDKKQLVSLKEYIKPRLDSHRIKGIDVWKEERNPGEYFSNHKDKLIILGSILPEDGIGRSIKSSEMLKSIYGDKYVKEAISSFEGIKEKV